jgi:hypothetical protein
MAFRATLVASWKFALSSRRRTWELRDYPIIIREQQTDLALGERYRHVKQQRYLARIVKWWVMTGGGDTPQDAIQDLALQFDRIRTDWRSRGKELPRPGTQVPLEFAPSQHIQTHQDLAEDFIRRVLGMEWAFISDQSSLWDFHLDESNSDLQKKVQDIYGVDVSDIESGNIATILARIAAGQRKAR